MIDGCPSFDLSRLSLPNQPKNYGLTRPNQLLGAGAPTVRIQNTGIFYQKLSMTSVELALHSASVTGGLSCEQNEEFERQLTVCCRRLYSRHDLDIYRKFWKEWRQGVLNGQAQIRPFKMDRMTMAVGRTCRCCWHPKCPGSSPQALHGPRDMIPSLTQGMYWYHSP